MRKLFKLHIVYSTESAITNAHICIETLAVCYISKTKYDNNKYIAPPMFAVFLVILCSKCEFESQKYLPIL